MKKVVVSLGGNAFIRPGQKGTIEEQLKNVDKAMDNIILFVKKGYKIIITHGNGPQVGRILLKEEKSNNLPHMPLYICVAESQALIGYVIKNALYNKLLKHKINTDIVVLLTHVIVDKKDPAFKNPTKPIGPYYVTKKILPKDWRLVKTERGYRRIVASPKSKAIIESGIISEFMKTGIVIACGGGGIPVIKTKNGEIKGIDCVIDKDLTSCELADIINAGLMIILTDVNCIYLNYGKKNQKRIAKMNVEEAKKYLKQGHFLPGSMEPKIKASIKFLENGKKRKVVLTSFNLLGKVLDGKVGTIIE